MKKLFALLFLVFVGSAVYRYAELARIYAKSTGLVKTPSKTTSLSETMSGSIIKKKEPPFIPVAKNQNISHDEECVNDLNHLAELSLQELNESSKFEVSECVDFYNKNFAPGNLNWIKNKCYLPSSDKKVCDQHLMFFRIGIADYLFGKTQELKSLEDSTVAMLAFNKMVPMDFSNEETTQRIKALINELLDRNDSSVGLWKSLAVFNLLAGLNLAAEDGPKNRDIVISQNLQKRETQKSLSDYYDRVPDDQELKSSIAQFKSFQNPQAYFQELIDRSHELKAEESFTLGCWYWSEKKDKEKALFFIEKASTEVPGFKNFKDVLEKIKSGSKIGEKICTFNMSFKFDF